MFNRSRILILEAASALAALAGATKRAEHVIRGGKTAAPRKLKSGNIRLPVMGRYTSYGAPHEGKAEVARRRRQIEAGTLTRSNGLEVRS